MRLNEKRGTVKVAGSNATVWYGVRTRYGVPTRGLEILVRSRHDNALHDLTTP